MVQKEMTVASRIKRLAIALLLCVVGTAGVAGMYAPPLRASGGCCAVYCKYKGWHCINEDDCQGGPFAECCYNFSC
jgi:hypothetical protein